VSATSALLAAVSEGGPPGPSRDERLGSRLAAAVQAQQELPPAPGSSMSPDGTAEAVLRARDGLQALTAAALERALSPPDEESTGSLGRTGELLAGSALVDAATAELCGPAPQSSAAGSR
jgi:hypothetical protein